MPVSARVRRNRRGFVHLSAGQHRPEPGSRCMGSRPGRRIASTRVIRNAALRGQDFVMDTQEQTARIRTLRAKGLPPRTSPGHWAFRPPGWSVPSPLNRAPTPPSARSCTAGRAPGWRVGLALDGHPEWSDLPHPDTGAAGLVAVLSPVTRAAAGSASAATRWTSTASA